MLLRCARCLRVLNVDAAGWLCPTHGEVQSAHTSADGVVSPEVARAVLPVASARRAASPRAQPMVKRCRVCREEFETVNPRHRYCPKHVERLNAFLTK